VANYIYIGAGMKPIFYLALFALFPLVCFAGEVPAELNTLFMIIGPFLAQYAEKYPLLAQVLSIMVTARLVIKPLMSALLTISKDTEFKFLEPLKEFSDNKAYKTVAFFLDWLLSVKLPKKA